MTKRGEQIGNRLDQKFNLAKRELTPRDYQRFEVQVLAAVRKFGGRVSLVRLVETCAPLDPTGLGVSTARMSVLHLVEQGQLSLKKGVVTLLERGGRRRR